MFLPLCQILCHCMSFLYSKTLAYYKNPSCLCQDVFNTQGYKCTHTKIRILRFMFTFLIWNITKPYKYNDIKFCKEAKLFKSIILWSYFYNIFKSISHSWWNVFVLPFDPPGMKYPWLTKELVQIWGPLLWNSCVPFLAYYSYTKIERIIESKWELVYEKIWLTVDIGFQIC